MLSVVACWIDEEECWWMMIVIVIGSNDREWRGLI